MKLGYGKAEVLSKFLTVFVLIVYMASESCFCTSQMRKRRPEQRSPDPKGYGWTEGIEPRT